HAHGRGHGTQPGASGPARHDHRLGAHAQGLGARRRRPRAHPPRDRGSRALAPGGSEAREVRCEGRLLILSFAGVRKATMGRTVVRPSTVSFARTQDEVSFFAPQRTFLILSLSKDAWRNGN